MNPTRLGRCFLDTTRRSEQHHPLETRWVPCFPCGKLKVLPVHDQSSWAVTCSGIERSTGGSRRPAIRPTEAQSCESGRREEARTALPCFKVWKMFFSSSSVDLTGFLGTSVLWSNIVNFYLFESSVPAVSLHSSDRHWNHAVTK
jgi:hypothetical protein